MPSFVYDAAKKGVLDGSIALETDTIKLALLTDAHSPSAADEFYADVEPDEISGDGYTAGGIEIDVALSRTGDTVEFDAVDIDIESLAPDFRYAVVYSDTGASKPLLALLDPGALQEPSGGSVTLTFNASGIFTLTDA